MAWMRLLCRRCRARWRMSSDVLGGRGRVVAPPPVRVVCCLFWSVVCCGGKVE